MVKFYQTIAPTILSIIYTATIFGMRETNLPHIPPEICAIIDKFSGKNDGHYKQTGHIKPYSRLLDVMTNYGSLLQCISYQWIDYLTYYRLPLSCLLIGLYFRFRPKFSPVLSFLIPMILIPMILSACKMVRTQLRNSRLTIKFPTKIDIDDILGTVRIHGENRKIERRSFPDMRFKFSFQCDKKFAMDMDHHQDPIIKDELTFALKNGKVNIHLIYDYCEPSNKDNNPLTRKSVHFFWLAWDGTFLTHSLMLLYS